MGIHTQRREGEYRARQRTATASMLREGLLRLAADVLLWVAVASGTFVIAVVLTRWVAELMR